MDQQSSHTSWAISAVCRSSVLLLLLAQSLHCCQRGWPGRREPTACQSCRPGTDGLCPQSPQHVSAGPMGIRQLGVGESGVGGEEMGRPEDRMWKLLKRLRHPQQMTFLNHRAPRNGWVVFSSLSLRHFSVLFMPGSDHSAALPVLARV